MEHNLGSLIRYLRIEEGCKLEYLAKKIGISKSYLSQIETNKKKLSAEDLLLCLKYLNAELKIIKNGEDYMKKMNNDQLIKNGFSLTDVGYCKDYKDINEKNIRVEFCTLTNLNVVIAKDFKDTNKYLSTEKYNKYEELYSNDEGYGFFYEEYTVDDKYWDVILKYKNKKVIFNDIIFKIFDNNIIKSIKEDFLNILK